MPQEQTAFAMDDRADPIVLKVEELVKSYGPLIALDGVSLSVRRGSIHGLLGENGAGKSTLVNLISGQRQPTSGRILLDGEEVQGRDVKSMEKAGVFLVTQEPMIIDNLSAAENILLGIWPSRFGFVNWKTLRRQATEILKDSGIDIDQPAGKLDAVARRKLNILRAMFSGGRVIILDEPTTALNVDDRRQLFDFMQRLKSEGVTFIFISHYNDEILEICDAVSVLRDGSLAGSSDDVASMSSDQLSELVLGRGLELFERERRLFSAADPAMRFADVKSRNVDIANFLLHPGEIVGFAGLPGSGAKEFARMLFGLEPAKAGKVSVSGETLHPLPRHPHEAYSRGIAYLSDDRRRDGLVGQMSIGQNMTLSSLAAIAHGGFISSQAESDIVGRYFPAMGIKAPNPQVTIDTLSGGNQQKVCLGRVLATKPKILILDEPTRGIDIGVKQDVHRIIDGLTQDGVGVIIVTTDSDEMVRLVDRVCIFAKGEIRAELTGAVITKDRLRQLGSE
ncbi:MAG: sugar ABC transporter ATP-binding protein [Phyllobacterium sp.]